MAVRALFASALFASAGLAQLSGTVGPLTTSAEKEAVKVCNILDYGGVASTDTDNGAAISAAWTACVDGGQVYIPTGDYGLATWVTLKSGSGVSINIEGTIYRTGTDSGNMIYIQSSTDIEIYSATGTGAIQAYGYEFHEDGSYGARIMRLYKTSNFSIHDIALVDAPQFHLTLDTCESGEIYNTIIHGGYEGGLDGIDVWGSNIWIHDVEVSNKDECVTVKNPSDHLLIENVHCNWSGGCAMGSLGADTDIHDIEYRNIYTHNSNQMYMFKSNGGSGSVYNVALSNFTGHDNAYTLDLDSAWSSQSVADGDGISYYDITAEGWHGTTTDGTKRAPVRLLCPSAAPCYGLDIEDFGVGSAADTTELYVCQNAYGEGACLVSAASGSTPTATYTTTQTITPSNTAYTSMDNELSTGFDISSSIPIPTLPASFYPGVAPISAILSGSSTAEATAAAADVEATSTAVAGSTSAVASASSAVTSSAPSSSASASSGTGPAAEAESDSETPAASFSTTSAAVASFISSSVPEVTPASASSASSASSSAEFSVSTDFETMPVASAQWTQPTQSSQSDSRPDGSKAVAASLTSDAPAGPCCTAYATFTTVVVAK